MNLKAPFSDLKSRNSVWGRFVASRRGMAALWTVVVLLAVSFLAPLVAPYDPASVNVDDVLMGPSSRHWFGTDALGRDVLSRILHGGRISLLVGFVAEGIAIVVGVLAGAVAGYFGGRTDSVIMRFVDIMLCFPVFFLILSVVAFVEPSIWNIMLIIGLTGWMPVARLVRGEFLTLKEREFVLYERVLGASDRRIMFRHILPNALSPVIVTAAFGVAGAILVETALSFIGLGVQPPTPSWGNILTSGKDMLEVAWWITVFPGLFILVSVLAYNIIGIALKDALDPRYYE